MKITTEMRKGFQRQRTSIVKISNSILMYFPISYVKGDVVHGFLEGLELLARKDAVEDGKSLHSGEILVDQLFLILAFN